MSEKYNIPESNSSDSMEGSESQNNPETILDSNNSEKLEEIKYLKSIINNLEYVLNDLNMALLRNNFIPIQIERVFFE